MAYIAAMISMGMTMAYAGAHEDMAVLMFVGLLTYGAGIIIGEIIEGRANDKIKALEKEIKELKLNGCK